MAINTAQKRYSTASFNQVYMPGVVPTATITQDERQAICMIYSGILAYTPTAAKGGSSSIPIWWFYD